MTTFTKTVTPREIELAMLSAGDVLLREDVTSEDNFSLEDTGLDFKFDNIEDARAYASHTILLHITNGTIPDGIKEKAEEFKEFIVDQYNGLETQQERVAMMATLPEVLKQSGSCAEENHFVDIFVKELICILTNEA